LQALKRHHIQERVAPGIVSVPNSAGRTELSWRDGSIPRGRPSMDRSPPRDHAIREGSTTHVRRATVYHSLLRCGVLPSMDEDGRGKGLVGIIGIGGLGHLGMFPSLAARIWA